MNGRNSYKAWDLTPWYPHEIKPARVGYYQATVYRGGSEEAPMMLWNGTQWWHPINGRPCITQERDWRGLRSHATSQRPSKEE